MTDDGLEKRVECIFKVLRKTKRETFTEIVEMSSATTDKWSLGNLTPTGDIDSRWGSGKQRITRLMSLDKWVVKRDTGKNNKGTYIA